MKIIMLNSIIKLVIGDSGDKQGYKKMMKRINALPKDYRFVFRKMKHYMLVNGVDPYSDLTLFMDLVDLFEASAQEGKQVLDVIGRDVGAFCHEIMCTSVSPTQKLREKLNKEISEKFNKEGNHHARTN